MEKRIEYQGMTSQPSDYVYPDGDMKLAVNAEYREGGWKAVREPKIKIEDKEVVYVHTISDKSSRIYFYIDNDNLKAIDENNEDITFSEEVKLTDSDVRDFNSIGNIVTFLKSGVLVFLIYKESKNSYIYINGLPDFVNFEFRAVRQNLSNGKFNSPDGKATGDEIKDAFRGYKEKGANYSSLFNMVLNKAAITIPSTKKFSKTYLETMSKTSDKKNFTDYSDRSNFYTLENFVFGGLANIKNILEKKNLFMYPVLLKYALRLYDGSYINESPPILIFPNFETPIVEIKNEATAADSFGNFTLTIKDISAFFEAYEIQTECNICGYENFKSWKKELSKYTEIIKSVDIFISQPLYSVDLSDLEYYWDVSGYVPAIKRKVLKEEIEKISVFYFVSSIEYKTIINSNEQEWMGIFDDEKYKLEGYTENTTLNGSSTFNGKKIANSILNYNGRILAYGVSKNHLENINLSIEAPMTLDCYDGNDIKVTENSYANEINKIYKTTTTQGDMYCDAFSFFNCYFLEESLKAFSESFAKLMIQVNNGSIVIPYFISVPENNVDILYINNGKEEGFKLNLKPHPFLNTSYVIPLNDSYMNLKCILDKEKKGYFSIYKGRNVIEGNMIYMSKVSNPFSFNIDNYITVGCGNILSIQTNAMSIALGQFGQYPLYAFCTDGVYSIGIGTDGTLQNCVPLSYDILTDKHSVGKMEQIVVFATREGIIALSGSERKVLLAADKEAVYTYDNDKQKDFITKTVNDVVGITPPHMTDLYTYITTGLRFAFDANHCRLIAFNPAYDYSYIMDAKTNNWSVFYKGFDSVLNIPEQCLLVRKETNDDGETEYNVYDYSSDEVVDIQHSYFITRPFKLDMPDVHKSIQSIIQRGVFCDRNDVQQALYGSNDLYNWTPVWSSKDIYLRGMRGSGYKYYKLAIFIPEFKQDKILHGCSVEFTPRLTNKPR